MELYEDCIIFLLAKAYQRVHAIHKELLRPYGLTAVQHLILGALSIEDGQSAGEIGQKLVLDGATLSGTLDRMAGNGWISKGTDSADRRMVRISLTPKAKNLAQVLHAVRVGSNQKFLKHLSLEEKLLLKRLLKDLC
ncbi:MarR family transcriptional regulator [Desulfarculales bacterium]